MLKLALSRGRAASLLVYRHPISSPLSILSRISTPFTRRCSSTETQVNTTQLNTEDSTQLNTEDSTQSTNSELKDFSSKLNISSTLPNETNKQEESTKQTPEKTKKLYETKLQETTNILETNKTGTTTEEEDQQTERTRNYYGHQIFIAARTENYGNVFKYCMEMKQMGVKPDIQIMEAVIDVLANVRSLDLAFIVFEQCMQMRLRPTRKVFDSLMKVCDMFGNSEVAQILVMKMRDLGAWPELATHNHLISIFVKTNYLDRAWLEYSAVKALYGGIHPDLLQNYYKLIVQSKNPMWTLKLLKENATAYSTATQNALITALEVFFETKYLIGCKYVSEAQGKLLDEGTLVQILHLAGRMKDEETVMQVFNYIREATQDSPSRTAYFALLNSFFYARNATKFLDVVNTMAERGQKLGSVFTEVFARLCETPAQIDVAIAHLVAQRELVEAQEARREAQETQEERSETQETQEQRTESQELKEERIASVSVDALSAVMRACARAGDVERATNLFSACVSDFKLMPDLEAFNSVIRACERSANVVGAVTLMEQMGDNGVPPTAETYYIVIDVCVAANDLDRAIAVLSEMVNNNLQPTYQTYSRLAHMCASIGDYIQADAILQAMVANGLQPDELLIHTVTRRQHAPVSQSAPIKV